MDPFKLLSRSSKLQKSSSTTGARFAHIPSAADSGHLGKPSSNSLDFDRANGRGIKRKRQHENDFQVGEKSWQSSSFHTSSDTTDTLADGDLESERTIGPPKKLANAEASSIPLDQDDCRRILKLNRLKITLLGSDSLNGEKRKERHKRLSRRTENGNETKKAHTQLTTQPLQSFKNLVTKYKVPKRLGSNLDAQGYRTPTEVQLGSLPLLLGNNVDRGLQPEVSNELEDHGRAEIDLLTIAPTGSGKTLAFLIHLVHGLRQDHQQRGTATPWGMKHGSSQALILAPTHELADQIVNEGKKLALGTGIRISRIRKGMSLDSDNSTGDAPQTEETLKQFTSGLTDDQATERSKTKADILVSTPMLLLHVIKPSPEVTAAPLTQVRYLVLDEADVLLDPLFRMQTLDVWNVCTNPRLQTSLWSATIGSSTESLAQSFILDRRRKLELDVGQPKHHILRLVVGLKDSAVPNISHQLVYAATERGKLMALRQMIHPTAATPGSQTSLQPPFLVFTQTISRAIALHSELLYDIPSEAGGSSRIAVLHSDLSDTARSAVMAGFRKGEIWILITTDLLARGVDFRGINGVVNYDIPNTSGIYVHRVGRTGRQGREGGVAVTLYTKEDIKYVKNVANVIAVSEKQRDKLQHSKSEVGLQRWLLDALPDVSKNARKELKRNGVEARKPAKKMDDGGKEARRMRISTKSGYDRRLKQKRKDAVAGSQRRLEKEDSDEDWEGIED
ncbi:MAG: hypothetical protein Q9166_005018 [cf. Caloplaca sp. 2 TL-2023]